MRQRNNLYLNKRYSERADMTESSLGKYNETIARCPQSETRI